MSSSRRMATIAVMAAAAVGLAVGVYLYLQTSAPDEKRETSVASESLSGSETGKKEEPVQKQSSPTSEKTKQQSKRSPKKQSPKANSVPGQIAAGTNVRISGLKARPELNGTCGVVKVYVASKQRYKVALPDGSEVGLKKQNIYRILGNQGGAQTASQPQTKFEAKARVESHLRDLLSFPSEKMSDAIQKKQEAAATKYLCGLANGTNKEIPAKAQEQALKDGVVWLALNAGQKEFTGSEDRFAKVVAEVVATVEARDGQNRKGHTSNGQHAA